MPRIRVGVLGCGMIAQLMHLPYLAELEDRFEIAALCDQDKALAQRVAARYRVPRVHESFETLLDAVPSLDAVLVLNKDHFGPALMALDRGIHTFTEKPLCYTLAEAERLVGASERTGAKLMVGYMKRHDSGVQRGLAEIRRTSAPRMARVHVVVGPDYGNWIIPELQRIERPTGAGTAASSDADGRLPKVRAEFGAASPALLAAYMDMFGVWSHDINVFRAAFPAAPTSVKAHVSDDGSTLTALLHYADGLQCVFQGGTTSAHLFEENLTVWGADRTVELDLSNPFLRHVPATVRIREDEGTPSPGQARPPTVERTVRGSHHEAFKAQLCHFHACVTTPALRPITTGREALEDTRLMLGILRAAAE
ncbi:Gfo/Idh/MocA family protein [Streptomyces pathocidini]|uniref:Gfo/Idh/MocA family protein n=1 Tax=Streptomyces pathocidini TaxID=1650571 RepID=A0ABW7UYA3_9ACTN|nr:Gfo/Idh/MocA family oxidoreductase [Streptomyces pathocidini]